MMDFGDHFYVCFFQTSNEIVVACVIKLQNIQISEPLKTLWGVYFDLSFYSGLGTGSRLCRLRLFSFPSFAAALIPCWVMRYGII
jgi:hypothetical protein